MPTIHTPIHKPFTDHSQGIHKPESCESKHSQASFTTVHGVNFQVQNDYSQTIHTHSHNNHGTLVRVMNSSPEGGFITACTRERLTGLDLAKAGQMVAILDRIESAGVEVQAARDALRAAMYGTHNSKDVLAELLTVADACHGRRTLTGEELAAVASREFGGAA